MARIEGIGIRNYRSLKDVTLGKTFETQGADELPRMMAAIGPNGCGKSSLIDAFGFLGDCLQLGVESACDQPHRGGFGSLRTKASNEAVQFEVYYREKPSERPISYSLHIDAEANGRPVVAYEGFRQRREGETAGHPFSFLELNRGEGYAWAGQATDETETSSKVAVKLEDGRRLGITTLGNLAEHPRIVAFRKFLEGWYLSYFTPDLARGMPMAGAQKHLNREGDNLGNYLQYMERQHPRKFKNALSRIADKIPGMKTIKSERQKDGRLLLLFDERGYADPFYQGAMSDGTLKMLAYMLMVEDPEPAPLIGIEEPENGLHHQLLQPLAQEFKHHAEQRDGPQVLLATHSPYLVDALTPSEVWILEKNGEGFTTAQRAKDIEPVQALFDEGLPLGSLWYSDHFGRGNP